jgi:DNA-binding PadR family transcriptional regulator
MIAGMHGGRREGAGRKPLSEGITRRLYSLTPRHVELLEQYRQTHALSTNSAALRHLIDNSERFVDHQDGCEPGLHTEIRQLTEAIHWNEEQRGIQDREIARLRREREHLIEAATLLRAENERLRNC